MTWSLLRNALSALERHVAETGEVNRSPSGRPGRRNRKTMLSHGEIETAHPGYLGSQDIVLCGHN